MRVTLDIPRVKFDASGLTKDKFLPVFKQELLTTLARLRSEIGRGKGADGQSIKPSGYSPEYAKRKAEGKARGGSRGKGVSGQGSIVNLTITGDLLGSIQVRSVTDGAQIFFNGQHYSGLSNTQLASVLLGKGFEGWFEYGDTDIKRIEQRLNKMVDEAVKKMVVVK